MWFDDLFKDKGGSPIRYAFNETVGKVPIIGQYLGAYMQASDDTIDLNNPFSNEGLILDFTGGGGFSGWDRNEASKRSFARSEGQDYSDLVDGGQGSNRPSQNALGSPDLQADNRMSKAAQKEWDHYRHERLPSVRSEMAADAGSTGPPIPLSQPDEVRVHGPPRASPSAPVVRPPGSSRPVDMVPPTEGSRTRVPIDLDLLQLLFPGPETPPDRPEVKAPPPPEEAAVPKVEGVPQVQRTQEVVIEAAPPFTPAVSDPAALEAAEGRARIQWGDLVQLVRGGFNGLVSTQQEISRMAVQQVAGPVGTALVMPYAEPLISRSDAFRLTIDPRFGGAAIIGEQLSQNLAFEALPFLPQAAGAARRAMSSGAALDALVSPTFWFMGARGPGAGSGVGRALTKAKAARANYRSLGRTPVHSNADWAVYQIQVGSRYETVFEVTEGTRKRYIYVDHIEGNTLVEAKHGDMGQMFNAEREAHIHRQIRNYLGLMDGAGFDNIIYRVSTKKGADRLRMVFARDYPAVFQSGRLQVEYLPFRTPRSR